MTDKQGASLRNAEHEITRLAGHGRVVERRLQVAEAEARAACTARDVAIKVAANPWRRPR
jgi:hypothetical protein